MTKILKFQKPSRRKKNEQKNSLNEGLPLKKGMSINTNHHINLKYMSVHHSAKHAEN